MNPSSDPLWRVPLWAALRDGGAEGRRGTTRLFYGLLGGVALWIVSLGISPGTVEWTMRRFHLTGDCFALWYPGQVVPAMYSFANEYALSRRDLPVTEAFEGPEALPTAWVNHYPPRLFTFGRRAGLRGDPLFLYCRSRYQGRAFLSKMRVDRAESGGFRMSLVEEQWHGVPPVSNR